MDNINEKAYELYEKTLRDYWYELLLAVREYKMCQQEELLMAYQINSPFWQNVQRRVDVRAKADEALRRLEDVLLHWPLINK